MPNHITNKLQIIGKDVAKVRDFIRGEDLDIDFNKIIPMPEELHVEAHSGVLDAAKNALDVPLHENELIGMLESENRKNQKSPLTFSDEDWDDFIKCLQNMRNYGHLYWYDWAVENWGTKWNSYGQDHNKNTLNTVWFETAWSMPEPVIKALSEEFPHMRFKIEWADEDTGYNVGMKMFEDGELNDERIPEGGTREAYEFCFALQPHKEQYYKLENGNYEYAEE